MKQEYLAQMIGAIDDDLIAEAYQPFPRVHRTHIFVSRLVAAAACLAAVLAIVLTALPKDHALLISVGGIRLSADVPSASVPLVATLQPRSVTGTELVLQMDAGAESVTMTAGANSVLISEDGSECTQVVCSGSFEQIWLVDTASCDTFELILQSESQQFCLTAVVDPLQNAILVTLAAESPRA